MSVRVRLRGMLRRIRADALRNVGLLVGRLILVSLLSPYSAMFAHKEHILQATKAATSLYHISIKGHSNTYFQVRNKSSSEYR